ncbi:MAG: hypothetical protein ACRDWE_03755 [Acidimicrobiales bacterium]
MSDVGDGAPISRSGVPRWARHVRAGASIDITEHGHPVARVVAYVTLFVAEPESPALVRER